MYYVIYWALPVLFRYHCKRSCSSNIILNRDNSISLLLFPPSFSQTRLRAYAAELNLPVMHFGNDVICMISFSTSHVFVVDMHLYSHLLPLIFGMCEKIGNKNVFPYKLVRYKTWSGVVDAPTSYIYVSILLLAIFISTFILVYYMPLD